MAELYKTIQTWVTLKELCLTPMQFQKNKLLISLEDFKKKTFFNVCMICSNQTDKMFKLLRKLL